ncbi:hypothetical protein ABIA35_008430 [Catenulispora sp. MAP12-49]
MTDVMRQLDAVPGAPAHRYLYYPAAGHSMVGSPLYITINPGRHGGTQGSNALAAADAWPRSSPSSPTHARGSPHPQGEKARATLAVHRRGVHRPLDSGHPIRNRE